ncbi:ArsA family ATPase [Patulibacter minatonensis]|uniref:ArsA family ATPase n=1 Tax=Patulibacter minatonensis TaxID=298163 RepID=UPI000683ED18|nr:ArsA-related P-loop ATPase [Patulibacter minatonensis]
MALMDRRLLLVTGKGGTGKTSVAAALAVLAARQGKRVLLAEIAGERLSELFGHRPVGHHETPIQNGLSLIAIEPIDAAHDFLRSQVGAAVHRVIFQNRLFTLTMTAAPGLREVSTVDRLWDLTRRDRGRRKTVYDLVIVDAPATGHALAMLRSPATYGGLARGGPIKKRADEMASLLEDRTRTSVVLCALPEETPVNETLETAASLRDLHVDLGLVVLNRTRGTLLADDEADAVGALVPGALDDPDDGGGLAVRSAAPIVVEHRRARREERQQERLRAGLDDRVPLVLLPRRDGEVLRKDLGDLADELAGAAL